MTTAAAAPFVLALLGLPARLPKAARVERRMASNGCATPDGYHTRLRLAPSPRCIVQARRTAGR